MVSLVALRLTRALGRLELTQMTAGAPAPRRRYIGAVGRAALLPHRFAMCRVRTTSCQRCPRPLRLPRIRRPRWSRTTATIETLDLTSGASCVSHSPMALQTHRSTCRLGDCDVDPLRFPSGCSTSAHSHRNSRTASRAVTIPAPATISHDRPGSRLNQPSCITSTAWRSIE